MLQAKEPRRRRHTEPSNEQRSRPAESEEPPIGRSMVDPHCLNTASLLDACVFATEQHKEQKRKSSNLPYIIHPMRLARMGAGLGYGNDVLIPCMLHDVLEDTECSEELMTEHFGAAVVETVKHVTKDPNLHGEESKRAQEQDIYSYNTQACIVKLLDIIDNVDSIKCRPIWGPERTEAYLQHKKASLDILFQVLPYDDHKVLFDIAFEHLDMEKPVTLSM
ncbi:hypothetical protein PCE1_004103 [Barthelona sp. PCE]